MPRSAAKKIKEKQTHRLRKQTYGYPMRKVGGRNKSGGWEKHLHTNTYKIDNQQGPTV